MVGLLGEDKVGVYDYCVRIHHIIHCTEYFETVKTKGLGGPTLIWSSLQVEKVGTLDRRMGFERVMMKQPVSG